jgi:peptidoglycan/LPS O-acetylase OafA/YrhL
MREQINALTGLRGIAASWVLIYHSYRLTEDLDAAARAPMAFLGAAGYLGVDIFFVLSGFVIAYNYAHKDLHTSWSQYGSYLWKRLARLYPVHIAALVFFAVTLPLHEANSDQSLLGLVKTLTLTHAWDLPVPKIWAAPSWSISAEWVAYLGFPVLALMTRRFNAAVSLAAIAALLGLFYLSIVYGPWPGNSMGYGLHRIAFEFATGVVLYRLWSHRKLAINVATLVALVGLLLGGSAIDVIDPSDRIMAAGPVFATVIVYGFACATGALAQVMTRLEHLGHISYSLYLLQSTVLGVMIALLRQWDLTTDTVAVYTGLAVAIAITYGLSDLTYRYIETPARIWMLSLFKRKPAQAVTSASRTPPLPAEGSAVAHAPHPQAEPRA